MNPTIRPNFSGYLVRNFTASVLVIDLLSRFDHEPRQPASRTFQALQLRALRPDVQFHDGTPLDAQALKTIFDQYLKAPTSNLSATLSEVTSLDVVDDLTVRYNLTETNAAFPDVLTGAAGWPFSPTAAAAYGSSFTTPSYASPRRTASGTSARRSPGCPSSAPRRSATAPTS